LCLLNIFRFHSVGKQPGIMVRAGKAFLGGLQEPPIGFGKLSSVQVAKQEDAKLELSAGQTF
jgi:hypothetical protein